MSSILERAIQVAESQKGYHYDPAKIEAKVAEGLVKGDILRATNQRATYLGEGRMQIERYVNGAWVIAGNVTLTQAQADELLANIAAARADLGYSMIPS